MKKLEFVLAIILFTTITLQAAEPIISGYDEIVNEIIQSNELDLSKIAIVNIPLLRRNSFYTVELDYVILGPKVKEIEQGAFVGCLIRNLIVFNPEIVINESIFMELWTSRKLGFDQHPGPRRLIANVPIEFIRRSIFDDLK